MDNAKQIRRINNIFGSLKAKCGKEDDIRNTLSAMMKDHEDELTPSPEPKPLKLEAGARVLVNSHMYFDAPGTVISVHKSEPSAYSRVWWVSDRGSVNSTCEADITVVEAATPEPGDTVQKGKDTFLVLSAHCPGGYFLGTRSLISGRTGTWHEHDDFTILHKAPKE